MSERAIPLGERALDAALGNATIGAAAIERCVELLRVLSNEPLVCSSIRLRARRYLSEIAEGVEPGAHNRALAREAESWPEGEADDEQDD